MLAWLSFLQVPAHDAVALQMCSLTDLDPFDAPCACRLFWRIPVCHAARSPDHQLLAIVSRGRVFHGEKSSVTRIVRTGRLV